MGKNWELKHEEGKGYWYEDDYGNKSEIFESAEKYSCGYGVVRKKSGNWAYRDVNGNLSKEYGVAWSYFHGFGIFLLKFLRVSAFVAHSALMRLLPLLHTLRILMLSVLFFL